MPPEERPRQRLLRTGAKALSDAEVLSLVLGNGCREVCPLELARGILNETGGLPGLVGIRLDSLQRRGLGEAKAATVLASLEIARRLAEFDLPDRQPMARPYLLVRYLFLRYAVRDQEVVGALYLDGRSRLMGEEEFFRGALSKATVEPRQILAPALQRSAVSVCLFHTHPSGDPSPSLEDLNFTRRMAEACNAVGVQLLDHLILGGTRRWVSLRDRGAF
ncbi:MAG TPA: DNA repair protein RadC [Thermoanaerobaculia bacterium]|nr:DNA repair protein RadC [Thermoanaerobaculia bacterium]